MSDFITKTFSQLFIPKKDGDTDNNSELCAPNSAEPNSLPSYKRISSELWLLIFRNLERNDLDSCASVCVWWHEIIRHNGKYLPGREIDYIMFSSKRAFSMILSSGSIIKVYRFDKYFTLRGTRLPVDHPSFMTVRTYRRSPSHRKPSPGNNQLRLFIDELRMLTNRGAGGGDSSSSTGINEASNEREPIGKFVDVDAIGLHYPHFVRKTSYRITTPPPAFFMKLNGLLRNLDHINFIVFQTFTLTNAFVERFIHFVEPTVVTNDVRLIRFKLGKTHHRAIRFFFGAILENKHVLERLPPAGATMINWEY